jgi:hypothetical protein
MIKAAKNLWNKLARQKRAVRWTIKILIFLTAVLFITMPNPLLTVRQLHAYLNTEALFDPNFPEMQEINAEINARLPQNYTFTDEYKTIVQFVYDSVRYEFDWDNWLNSEYWPSARQVWQRRREDCDGRAILAVSIFRARGYADANIVGSLRHLWIKVGDHELMGPDREKTMVVRDGKKRFLLPSWSYILSSAAMQLDYYPLTRMMLMLFVFLVLCFHPSRNLPLFAAISANAFFGLMLIIDWARYVSFYERTVVTFGFVFGSVLLISAIIVALGARQKITVALIT